MLIVLIFLIDQNIYLSVCRTNELIKMQIVFKCVLIPTDQYNSL